MRRKDILCENVQFPWAMKRFCWDFVIFQRTKSDCIDVNCEITDINEREDAASGLLWYLALPGWNSLVVALITKTAYLSSKPAQDQLYMLKTPYL